jgi:hypothetical protein
LRPGAQGVVALGASFSGLPLAQAVQGCFADRTWLVSYDEGMPNGDPEFNATVARAQVEAFTRRQGPALEQNQGHRYRLSRHAAKAWVLSATSGRLEIPLGSHGHLVLLGGQPPPRWLHGDRVFTDETFLCAPLPQGVSYRLTLQGVGGPPEPSPITLEHPLDPARTLVCPVSREGGKTVATCPPAATKRERPLWRVRGASDQIRWSSMALSWGARGP